MTQPHELVSDWPIDIAGGKRSRTTMVWKILKASFEGDFKMVQEMVNECPELAYAQFNYTPPIYFAVREGHVKIVNYLLERGAWDPAYRTYPFRDNLITMAEERKNVEIASQLKAYAAITNLDGFKGDNGEIHFPRTTLQQEFEEAVDKENIDAVTIMLQQNPGLANDPTYFWGEGILLMPAKEANIQLMELLLRHGAIFPAISKWPHAYYFETYEGASFILENGMSPNHKTWQELTILHYMAQKGKLEIAGLLIRHGADLNAIDDEYKSTPLGLAARCGQTAMVKYLLESGADPSKADGDWATPLAWARAKNFNDIIELL